MGYINTFTLDSHIQSQPPQTESNSGKVLTFPFDYTTASDFDLAKAAGRGDVVAFEQLYNRTHRRVFGTCFRMLKNIAEAEDMTQVIYIQVYRKVGSFRGESAFTTWLHRLTVNEVLMHFRREKRRKEQITDDEELPDIAVVGSTNPNRMHVVDKIALKQAIPQLPDGYRDVYILHQVYGFTHEEIAEMLGCSEGTCKSQLYKAKHKLRRLIKGNFR